ncbi:TonB family protein / TonB-dependent receptor [Minicystis rosea]|nr:TonB family protein / TonB-dependent receptor [Minicystis rosea]
MRYPDKALQERFFETVTVTLVLEVDASGAVRKATVEAAQGHGFDEVAVAAAEKLTFEPALRDGSPVAARFKFRYVFPPPPARLVGRVALLSSDAPLRGVLVTARAADGTERTTETAADGSWSIADAPRGPVHVTVTLADHAPETADAELTPGEETRVVLRLAPQKPSAPAPDAGAPPALEIQVRGERPPREVTKRTLEKEEIALIPGTNGDALRSIQSLPGVARPPPFSGQLIVRGSAPEDTSIFVDGTLVPLVYHFGGLSSVVPTELLDKIDFYPGNYSTLYGRGMGGMADVGIRDPKKDGLHGMAQLDLIDARLLVEGPIAKTGWNFLAAGRRSWFDLWLGPVLKSTGASVSTVPVYYDYQLMLQHDFNQRSSFRVLFFGSDDAMALVNQTPSASNPTFAGGFSSHTSFWRVQARYQNKITDSTQIKVMAAVGQDSNDVGFGSNFFNTSSIPISGRAELTQKVVRGVTVNVGLDVNYSPYTLHVRLPAPRRPGVPSGGPLDMPIDSSDSGARFQPGAYMEWELVPWSGARIVPGVRLDYSSATQTWDVSPRINMRQDLTRGFPRTTLKGGVGLFYQPPQLLETDPTFGQKGLSSNRALQADFGVEQELHRQVDLSVDVFYKYLDRLVTQGAGNTGRGLAYGGEWFLRYKADDRFFGWLSYTLSRSERSAVPSDPFSPFQYDQTHVLTVLGSYNFGGGWRLGARFRLVSGNPYTPNGEGAYDATAGVVQAAPAYPANGARLGLFHQLDVRLDKTWTFKWWKLTAYLDIQNIYNRQSPEGVSYNYNYTQSTTVGGLPILPSFGLRGEL